MSIAYDAIAARALSARSIGVFPGGGTQGLISVALARAFEARSGLMFHENFDQVEGLSVGALNASALWPLRDTGMPVLSTAQLHNVYLTEIEDAFVPKKWSLGGLLDNKYDIANLEKLMQKTFGDLKLSDFEDGLHIHVVDLKTQAVRTLRSEDARLNPSEDFYMRDLLRAAVSAPYYFSPIEIKNIAGGAEKFVDGGLFSSDPSLLAFIKARTEGADPTLTAITTFGTGNKNNENVSLSDLDGGLAKISNMLSVMFKSKANTMDELLRIELGPRYVRLDTDLSNSGINIVAHHISDVVPYAERAVIENQSNIMQALYNIEATTEAGIDISKNILPFIRPHDDLQLEAFG